MQWRDEKEALLATIRRQEQAAVALAKRFKLLQQTLKEQQTLLDRYQRALSATQTAPKAPSDIAETSTNAETSRKIDKSSSNTTSTNAKPKESKHPPASTWTKKKAVQSSALETTVEGASVQVPVKKKVQEEEEKKKPVLKPTTKRGGLAATWAEEKRRLLKKPKWGQTLELSASGLNKENVRAEQTTDNPKGFAYVEVVRNREERKALPAHDCLECKKYYEALGGVGAADAVAQKHKCSRHRARFEPNQTPDDFWRLSFPDSVPEPKSPSVI